MRSDYRAAPSPSDTDRSSTDDHPAIDPEGLAASKAIQRRTGKTFHLATRLFPREVRHATYVLYGFVRIADEVVDAPDEKDPEDQRAAIDDLRAAALEDEPTDDAVLDAFQTVRASYGIRAEDVEAFLDSMAADVDGEGTRYRTREELDAYVEGSAAAVGRMMAAVMGVDGERARSHAASLGTAFQLTNFLRDVREDRLDLDRIYLPGELLARHGANHDAIERLDFDDRVAAAVREELQRAEEHYRHGVSGIALLPAGCQFPVLAAAVLYAEHHRLIRDRDFDVVSARPSLGRTQKLAALSRVGYQWWRTGDPETAFYAAGAVPRLADEPRAARAGDAGRLARRVARRFPGLPRWVRGD